MMPSSMSVSRDKPLHMTVLQERSWARCKVAAESCQLDDVVRDGNSDAATGLGGQQLVEQELVQLGKGLVGRSVRRGPVYIVIQKMRS